MKLEIYGEPRPPEAVVRLRLKAADAGHVTVEAVEEDGNLVLGGALLTFQADGTLTIHGSVSSCLGFKVDPAGRIQQTPEF